MLSWSTHLETKWFNWMHYLGDQISAQKKTMKQRHCNVTWWTVCKPDRHRPAGKKADDLDGNAAEALKLLLESAPTVTLCLFFILHILNERLLLKHVTYTRHIFFCTYYSCLLFTWVIMWLIGWFVVTHFALWLVLTHTVAYDSLNRTTHTMTRTFAVTHIIV